MSTLDGSLGLDKLSLLAHFEKAGYGYGNDWGGYGSYDYDSYGGSYGGSYGSYGSYGYGRRVGGPPASYRPGILLAKLCFFGPKNLHWLEADRTWEGNKHNKHPEIFQVSFFLV